MSVESRLSFAPVDSNEWPWLVEAWDPWFPYDEHLGRFFASIFNPTLRCEHAIYRTNHDGSASEFVTPGGALEVSPDGMRVAFMCSHIEDIWHSIKVYEIGTEQITVLVELMEADPHSGASWGYEWSKDSKLLRIRGNARYVNGRRNRPSEIHLIYDTSSRELVDWTD